MRFHGYPKSQLSLSHNNIVALAKLVKKARTRQERFSILI